MNVDLNDRRRDAEAALAKAQDAAGKAMYAGRSADMARVEKYRLEVEALTLAEQEQARAAAIEAEKQRQAQITAQKTEIADLMSSSAKALADSRAAYAQGAASMRTHLQTEAALRKAQAKLNELTGGKAPIQNQLELERKRSLQIAAVGIKPITNHPSRFGGIEYPNTLPEWR